MAKTDEIPDEVTSSGSGWVSVVTPKKPLLHLPLREIWRYRDLITLMVWRDFISLHKQTIFGPLWYFVQPLVSTVVYQIVFGNIARLPTNNIPPFLFYMSGIVIWYYFSACLSRTATHFRGQLGAFHQSLLSAADHPDRGLHQQHLAVSDSALDLPRFLPLFPREGRSHTSQLPDHHHPIPGIANGAPRAWGRMSYLSAQHTVPRFAGGRRANGSALDVRAAASFYPRSMVPEYLQWIMTLNPVVPIIEGFRFALMGQGQVEIYQWLSSLAITFHSFDCGPHRVRSRRKDLCRYHLTHPRLVLSHR